MTRSDDASRKRFRQSRRRTGDVALGDRIRKFRIQRGLSQEALAHLVGRSEGWVWLVENGQSDPGYADLVALAGVLKVAVARLVAEEVGTSGQAVAAEPAVIKMDARDERSDASSFGSSAAVALEEIISVTRRQLVSGGTTLSGLAAGAGAAEPLERLAYALRHPGRVDQQTIAHLERVTVALERLEPMSDGTSMLGLIGGHLDTVSALLQGAVTDAMRRQLCSIAAEAAGLAAWLRFMSDDSTDASVRFQIALEAATAAEDRALGAYLMGRAACQPFYREEPEGRLTRLHGLGGFSPRDATPTTRAWLDTLAAEAYALAGREGDCLRALERAESMMGEAPADEVVRPRVTFFDRVWLDGAKGVALVKLGRHDEAQVALHAALIDLDPLWQKHRTWLLAMLAESYVAQRRPDDACRVGGEALVIASSVRADADVGLIRSLRRELEPWRGMACVQGFDEQIALAMQV